MEWENDPDAWKKKPGPESCELLDTFDGQVEGFLELQESDRRCESLEIVDELTASIESRVEFACLVGLFWLCRLCL